MRELLDDFSITPGTGNHGGALEAIDKIAERQKTGEAYADYRTMHDLQSRKTEHLPMTTEEEKQLTRLKSRFREAQDAIAHGDASSDQLIDARIAKSQKAGEEP